jgi:hypothetical protein
MFAGFLSSDAISQSGLAAKVALHQFNLATEHLEVATVADSWGGGAPEDGVRT